MSKLYNNFSCKYCRVWDPVEKKMYYQNNDEPLAIFRGKVATVLSDGTVIDAGMVLMRRTSVKDKYSIYLYEGDIVHITNFPSSYSVEWMLSEYTFVSVGDRVLRRRCSDINQMSVVRIGNVFETTK